MTAHETAQPVARLRDLAPGDMLGVEVAGVEVLLARIGDDVFAVSNRCTHAEGWLDMGELDVAACEVECPYHGGRFDLKTGAATALPCVEPVDRYPVRVDGDDIYVDL